MSEQRIVVETLCEHEELGSHWGRFGVNLSLVECPGGSRRIVELPDMEKLREALSRSLGELDSVQEATEAFYDLQQAARWVLNLEGTE